LRFTAKRQKECEYGRYGYSKDEGVVGQKITTKQSEGRECQGWIGAEAAMRGARLLFCFGAQIPA
jgi:hypothetical protein